MGEKAVLLLSGGMDSAVLLADSISKYDQVTAISFNYGAKHNARELVCAAKLAAKYSVERKVVSLEFMNSLYTSSLLASGEAVPDGTYDTANMQSTVVPFRNGIMISACVGYAETTGAQTVLIGSHSGDHPVYPDTRDEFVAAISEAARIGTYCEVRVLAPFSKIGKADIAKIGRMRGVDFSLTWTCYKGLELHCGTCAACNERKSALGFQQGTDPTDYLR